MCHVSVKCYLFTYLLQSVLLRFDISVFLITVLLSLYACQCSCVPGLSVFLSVSVSIMYV